MSRDNSFAFIDSDDIPTSSLNGYTYLKSEKVF